MSNFLKYDSSFNYISTDYIDTIIGDCSTIGFASTEQSLNIVSPYNFQKIIWSPYVKSEIIDYQANEDTFTGQKSVINYGTGTNIWEETLFNSGNSWKSYNNGFFAQLVGQYDNESESDNYLLIRNVSNLGEKSFEYIAEIPKVVCEATKNSAEIVKPSYYLAVESQGFARTNANMEDESTTEVFKVVVSVHINVGGQDFCDLWTFVNESESTEDKTKGQWIEQNMADKWVQMTAPRIYQKAKPKNLFYKLYNITGNNITVNIYGYEGYDKDGNEITNDIIDLRLKDIKLYFVDSQKNEINDSDIEYQSYMNQNVKDSAEDITLIIGTNERNENGVGNPCAIGSLLGHNLIGSAYYYFLNNFNRNGTTDFLENLLCKSIKSNYLNPFTEVTCTINRPRNMFGYLTYNNWFSGNYGVNGMILDYSKNTAQITMQEIMIDNPDLLIVKNESL